MRNEIISRINVQMCRILERRRRPTHERRTRSDSGQHFRATAAFGVCERGEDVQGVLTLFCSGAAQVVYHALRVEELREQLEVEEEDGDRQEEEVEVDSGEVSQGDAPMNMTVGDNESAQEV